jgi:hypothetical protein
VVFAFARFANNLNRLKPGTDSAEGDNHFGRFRKREDFLPDKIGEKFFRKPIDKRLDL